MSFACHYCVVRFCPYPETEEFVNVGVVLGCPLTGYLDFRHTDPRHHDRASHFFPQLDATTYSTALRTWEDALKPHRHVPISGEMLDDREQQRQREAFKILVHQRESILFYSEPRVILADNPPAALDEVFDAYVGRRFPLASKSAPSTA